VQQVVVTNKRHAQRDDTRRRILEALVASLVAVGYVKTTTLEVQRRAGVSRGALLHHFPTREELFAAAVRYLVESNESAVRQSLSRMPPGVDHIERAIVAMADAFRQPAYGAELELWAAARTDAELRGVLRTAERSARRDLNRVVRELFGEPWCSAPSFSLVSEMTVQLLRGLAISRGLRSNPAHENALISQWAALARQLLQVPPTFIGATS
jgi:AcrR family transcriptional regulator